MRQKILLLTFKWRGIGRRQRCVRPSCRLALGRRLDEPHPGDENLAIGDMTVLFRWVAERLPTAKNRFSEAIDFDRYRNRAKKYSVKNLFKINSVDPILGFFGRLRIALTFRWVSAE